MGGVRQEVGSDTSRLAAWSASCQKRGSGGRDCQSHPLCPHFEKKIFIYADPKMHLRMCSLFMNYSVVLLVYMWSVYADMDFSVCMLAGGVGADPQLKRAVAG